MERIASGGSSVVWQARQRSVSRIVALKLLRSAELANPEALARFRREAQAVALLRHPHIIALHDFGVEGDQPWMAMEYVPGPSLAEHLAGRPLPIRRAAEWFLRIAEAVAHAHECGVLHRDLKPSNILLDAEGEPRLTDFGLAKQWRVDGTSSPDAGVTSSGQLLGTPHYLPPEQLAVRRSTVGPASDVYSLGAVLCEMLTGRPPFLGSSVEATLLQVLHTEAPSVRRLNPEVPVDLDSVCRRCLDKDPGRRYPDARHLADEIRRFLEGRPVQARPIGAARQLVRWCRRQPALAASLAGIVGLLVLGTGLTLWQWQRSEAHAARLASALLELRLQRAEGLFEQSESAAALARLARMLREDPANPVLRRRTSAALAHRALQRPSVPPLRHPEIRVGFFAPEGSLYLTTSESHARLWTPRTGHLLAEAPHRAPSLPAFSPDARWLATLASPRAIQVWIVDSGLRPGPLLVHDQPLRVSRMGGPEGGMPRAAPPWVVARRLDVAEFLSPNQLAVETADGMLHVWELPEGRHLRASPRPYAEFSGNRTVYLTPGGSEVTCWNAHTDEILHTFRHATPVRWARISHEGDRLATLCPEDRLRWWEVPTGRLISEAPEIEGEVLTMVFAPGGDRLAVQFRAGHISLFETASGRLLHRFPSQARRIYDWSFSPDGHWLAVADRDRILLWDTGPAARPPLPLHHEGRVISSGFGPDSRQFQATSVEGSALIWNLQPEVQPAATLPHPDLVTGLDLDPSGVRIATATRDGGTHLWNARTGERIPTGQAHRRRVESLRFSPDGRHWASGSLDGTVRIWDSSTGIPVTDPLVHGGPVRWVEYAPDGRLLLSASANGRVVIWAAPTGQPRASWQHPGRLISACFHPGGDLVATGGDEGTARVWRLEGTNVSEAYSLRHEIGIQSMDFSRDGRHLATAGMDHLARVWDSRTGAPISPPLRHSLDLTRVRFDRSGSRLLTACQDGAVRLWEVSSGRPLVRPMRHRDKVYDAVFDPEERLILSTSEDDTVRIWDAQTGFEVGEPYPQGPTMTAARWAPDGRSILVAAPGNQVQRWDVSCLFEPASSAWLADLAEAVGGRRVMPDDSLAPVPWESLHETLEQYPGPGSSRAPPPDWAIRFPHGTEPP